MKNKYSQFWEDLKSGKFASMVKESSCGEKVTTPQDVYNIMKPIFAAEDDVEKLYCLFLNAKNRILSIEKMFEGSITGANVYPREIIKKVLELKAVSVIMTHNHPSGDTIPSQEDMALTDKVRLALSSIDVTLHDHIVIGNGYTSL